MAVYSTPLHLQTALERGCERIYKRKSEVPFYRGEKAYGMFVILSGRVRLDFGVDSVLAHSYGPGALVGLPATLTRRNFSMTATATEDANLGFWSFEALDSLLRRHAEFCGELLDILGERMAENHTIAKALMTRDERPLEKSTVV